jgi:hypothetical protein
MKIERQIDLKNGIDLVERKQVINRKAHKNCYQ